MRYAACVVSNTSPTAPISFSMACRVALLMPSAPRMRSASTLYAGIEGSRGVARNEGRGDKVREEVVVEKWKVMASG